MNDDWMDLNFKQSFGQKMNNMKVHDDSKINIGKNILTNMHE